jgi:hypothetical protein
MEVIMPFTSEQELAGAVNNILAGLGGSSEKVAACLRDKGHQGQARHRRRMPNSKSAQNGSRGRNLGVREQLL